MAAPSMRWRIEASMGFEPFEEKMRAAGLGVACIAAFRRSHGLLLAGGAEHIGEDAIEPVVGLEEAPRGAGGEDSLLGQTAVIKLNGGLGTGMGLDRAKSLIEVKPGVTFLDLIARQAAAQRGRGHAHFLLMDSFATSADCRAYLGDGGPLGPPSAWEFMQNQVPKVDAATLGPVAWPRDPKLEWCPPGHGDIYPALAGSGWMERLWSEGIRYLFVSNADNLGATVDLGILGLFAGSGAPFLMEVARRTESDRKGGHLCRRRSDGRLCLREVAQCHEEDIGAFQDIGRHAYFNTNNLWLRLDAVRDLLAADGVVPLPVIVNRKTVDPRDPASPPVIQLETAMGAAIECFGESSAVVVRRDRFAPVKATGDLLVLRSDAYRVTGDGRVEPAFEGEPPHVYLDGKGYKTLADFERLFPSGPPSLRGCRTLRVEGAVRFAAGVVIEGDVVVRARGPGAELRAGTYRDAELVV